MAPDRRLRRKKQPGVVMQPFLVVVRRLMSDATLLTIIVAVIGMRKVTFELCRNQYGPTYN